MPKILISDRSVNDPSSNNDPLKLKFHDFDSLPMLKGVFHGTNPEGHHFICNGEPILVSAHEHSMATVNKALKDVAKGRLLTIQYLGWDGDGWDGEEETGRGRFEVIDVEATA